MIYQKSSPETIQSMFATIAQRYDRANTLFSLGLHKKWNQKLIDWMHGTSTLLDLCAGTGEIGLGFLSKNPTSNALLLDFCQEMLDVAQNKGQALKNRFQLLQADAQSIPLKDGSVDGVTIAYGIRNVKNPLICFQEAFRVLSSGGKFGILELTRPTFFPAKIGHRFYTRSILPLLGKLSAKNLSAYRYLANSVNTFATPQTLETLLHQVGFQHIQRSPLTLGSATLFTALKP